MLIGQRTELQSPFLRDGKRDPRRELHCAVPQQCEKTLPENGFHGQPRYYLLN